MTFKFRSADNIRDGEWFYPLDPDLCATFRTMVLIYGVEDIAAVARRRNAGDNVSEDLIVRNRE